MFHGADLGQSVLNERRNAIAGLPRPDGSHLKGGAQTVNQQANGFAVLASPEEFDDGLRLTIAPRRLRGTVAPADNAHATVHLATSLS